jgi:ABC-type antimicrobial peptide transport system permease subunit
MKSVHIPRPLILLILVIVAFLIGILRVFGTAHAAASTAPKVAVNGWADAATDLTPTPVPTNTYTDLPPQSTPTPVPASADTTGIIALAIVIVTTILVGAAWGVRRSPKKKTHQK